MDENQIKQAGKAVDSEAGEMEELKIRAEEYLTNWKRERADFINYKKDEAKRMEEFARYSSGHLLEDLVEALDGLYSAKNNAPSVDGIKEWMNGFGGAISKIEEFLVKNGVERIGVEGEKFDPLLHEAVGVEDKDGQNIVEVRPGYKMHDRVIRPARVKIVK